MRSKKKKSLTKTIDPLASEAGKALAKLRKPANMKRGDSEYYKRMVRIREEKKNKIKQQQSNNQDKN